MSRSKSPVVPIDWATSDGRRRVPSRRASWASPRARSPRGAVPEDSDPRRRTALYRESREARLPPSESRTTSTSPSTTMKNLSGGAPWRTIDVTCSEVHVPRLRFDRSTSCSGRSWKICRPGPDGRPIPAGPVGPGRRRVVDELEPGRDDAKKERLFESEPESDGNFSSKGGDNPVDVGRVEQDLAFPAPWIPFVSASPRRIRRSRRKREGSDSCAGRWWSPAASKRRARHRR